MNTISLERGERIWLSAYLPGVPADIEADIEAYASLREVFLEHLDKFHARVAYVSIGTEMSYAEWKLQGIAFAAWLQSQGVNKGDRVALMMPNCLQYPICLLGSILAGAVVVNINPLYTAHELKHVLKDSGACTLVIFENFAHTLEKVIAGSSVKRVVVAAIGDLLGTFKGPALNFVLRRVQKQVPAFNLPGALRFNHVLKHGRALNLRAVALHRDDLAFVQYTGGTTGDAKGVMLSHRNIIANLLQAKAWVGDQLDQEQQQTNVTLLPLYHIFSLTVNCLMFMCLGGRNILIANPRDVKRVQMILRKERFNGIAGVNTLFNGLLENQQFCARDFSDLRMVIAGGMATHTVVAKRWKQVTGLPIIEGYGLTECSPVVSISPIDIARMREMEFTGSIGVPLPSTWVRFVREDGELAEIGEPGELQVRGPQVMQGYWNRPQETAEVLDGEGWLATGDIGVMDARGYIRLVDRKKDLILVSGFNVYPNEIEDVVALHPGVGEVAAIGVDDGVAGQRVKIIVVLKDLTLTEEQILAHCREYLTGYKVPRYVEFRDTELPKTTVGKVLRRVLHT
ncbi:long-chain fatty acid--CoA ligase [Pseudomonas marginalis ICMP 9505]|nr:long-chain fatty acid--CoA ligase [Pseudomonas marginalis ICMP 9505]